MKTDIDETKPDPTDTELDCLVRGEYRAGGPSVRNLAKALRACRQRSKAYYKAVEAVKESWDTLDRDQAREILRKAWDQLILDIEALDSLPSVAKQGETDDAG